MSKPNKKSPNIWVTQHPEGGWQTRREDADRASGRFPTQQDAINNARTMAKRDGVEVIVQGKDGKIRSKDSYGKDPNPPKDKEH
jgi:hypothetical protein